MKAGYEDFPTAKERIVLRDMLRKRRGGGDFRGAPGECVFAAWQGKERRIDCGIPSS